MKAAVFVAPGRMAMEEWPDPVCGPGDILIKVAACAICGTDIRIFRHGHHNVHPPQVIGHEVAGTIAALGAEVEGYRAGDRVTIMTEITDGTCEYCQQGRINLCPALRAIGYHFPGGFAEYMLMPAAGVRSGNVLKLPECLSLNHATLVEPLSCCLNGQMHLGIGVGSTVVVVGAGPVGCMHAELARAQGATKVILADVLPGRLALARQFAVDVLIDSAKECLSDRVRQETDGRGADVVIVACSAGQAQEEAVEYTARGGRISFFGGLPKESPHISLNSNLIHYKEISVHGAFASAGNHYRQALAFLAAGKLDAARLVSHSFPLDSILEAFAVAGSGEGLKTIVTPWGGD